MGFGVCPIFVQQISDECRAKVQQKLDDVLNRFEQCSISGIRQVFDYFRRCRSLVQTDLKFVRSFGLAWTVDYLRPGRLSLTLTAKFLVIQRIVNGYQPPFFRLNFAELSGLTVKITLKFDSS